jgi:class 3 adenylate cyclase
MQAGPEALDDRSRRALLAHIRQDFIAPVGAIVGYAEILIEDAPRHRLDHLAPDLAKLRQAGLALQHMVDGMLEPGFLHGHADAGDDAAFGSRLRHDLRTPINAVKGYGEMLLEEAQEAAAAEFAGDLMKLLASADQLLHRIDALVQLATEAPDTGGSPLAWAGGSPEFLHLVPRGEAVSRRVAPARLLLVDDHQSNRDLLSRRLMREGHEVVVAENGETALRLIEGRSFDLVLLDLLMPGISGFEVLCRLKNDPRHADIPVIMISALDEIASVVRCIEAGADDYLPKTAEPVLLRARLNSSLERKRLRDRERAILEQLRVEKERSDSLLLNILPQPVVARLRLGEQVIADRVDDATILFADLVGFTSLAARLPATRLLELLNGLFTEFDRLSVRFGLEKIKTIGDAYMVAGGLFEQEADHLEAAAGMALAMLDVVREASRGFGESLEIRIGMHAGPVIAGIIGTRKFIYDTWGDTVNTASRMESHGKVGEVNVSVQCYRRLRDRFVLEARGLVELKGRGPMEAYLLRGRRCE